jgi:hypothetical protein
VEGIIDCAKESQWSLSISNALPNDGECFLQQAASSVIKSRRDDERQEFKLLKYKLWFLDEYCELHYTFWFSLNRFEQISEQAIS